MKAEEAGRGPRALIETAPAATIGYDEVKRRNATWSGDAVSLKVKERTAGQLMREVRWANLGWVYQVRSAVGYSSSAVVHEIIRLFHNRPHPLPARTRRYLQGRRGRDPVGGSVCARGARARVAGVEGRLRAGYGHCQLLPEQRYAHGACGPERVSSEEGECVLTRRLDPSRPLVSLSLGHACVFLLGTDSREVPPRPIVLRSGDVFVMSGKGRQNYHGEFTIHQGC